MSEQMKQTERSTQGAAKLAAGAGQQLASRLSGAASLSLVIDIAAIMALAVILTLASVPAYGRGWIWVAVLGGSVLGIVLGLLSQRFRWDAARTTLATFVAWFVLGGPLAMPNSLRWGFLPTGRTLRGLLTGPVTGWRDMLTVAPPLGTTYNFMTVPLLIALVSSLVAITLARRSPVPAAAWLPQSIALLMAWALGIGRSVWALPVGIALGVIVLVWTTYQRRRASSALVANSSRTGLSHAATGAVVLAICALLTGLLSPAVAPGHSRHVIRDVIEEPLDVRSFASPLQGFRGNILNHKDDTLMDVTGASGGAVVRIATLDTWDGLTYNVSNSQTSAVGDYQRVGAAIDDETPGIEQHINVSVRNLDGVWLPTVGHTRDVDFRGERAISLSDTHFHNLASQTSLVTAGLQPGDSYALDARWVERPDEAAIRAASAGAERLPRYAEVPDRVRDLATAWTSSAASAGERALLLETRFSTGGWFSHGVEPNETPSLSGHSYARVAELLADEEHMIGDEEQYSVAMALMARELGIPARVVYGYQIPDSGQVTGNDVRAWTEVNLNGLGWVQFNPTPPHDKVLPAYEKTDTPQTRPHVENPPPPPERPDQPPPDDKLPVDQVTPPKPDKRIDVQEVLRTATLFGLPIVVLLGPPALILGLKRRRRRTRMNDENVANRVAGGWSELVDQARDLGTTASPMGTRSEQAVVLASTFDKLADRVDTKALARQADAATFAPDPVAEKQAATYWAAVDEGIHGMRGSVGRRRAVLGQLSTRSFRRFSLPKAPWAQGNGQNTDGKTSPRWLRRR